MGIRNLSASVGQALDMVGCSWVMRMAAEIFRRAADGGEAQANLAGAVTRIHQDARRFGFHIGAIAGGTAAENGQANRHGRTLEGEL